MIVERKYVFCSFKSNYELCSLAPNKFPVQFTRDWRLDANRRDLTVNAMFLTLDGAVVDFFGGAKDLKERRVAFVGDPGERIKEDYLRWVISLMWIFVSRA